MRRTALTLLALTALAVPAAALAAKTAPNDGVLVVKKGQAPYFPGNVAKSTPVVQLTITGSVIGQVTDGGRIVIDAGPNTKGPTPYEVTIPGPGSDVKDSDTARAWSSSDPFKFRAVDGKFTILVYGSGVNLVAIGTGTVVVAGMPDQGLGDGWFSINDGSHRSLPATPTKQLVSGDGS